MAARSFSRVVCSFTVRLRKAVCVRKSWAGVEGLRDKLQRSLLGSFAEGASFALFAADAAHNLPFVHACAVLNDVLNQLKQEGQFQSKSIFLGALLDSSKSKLPWKNLPVIQEAVARRNDVAHHALGATYAQNHAIRFGLGGGQPAGGVHMALNYVDVQPVAHRQRPFQIDRLARRLRIPLWSSPFVGRCRPWVSRWKSTQSLLATTTSHVENCARVCGP